MLHDIDIYEIRNTARGTLVDASSDSSVNTLSFERKTPQLCPWILIHVREVDNSSVLYSGSYFSVIHQKIMGVECMWFLFLCRSKIMADLRSFHCMCANFG
jgi:hypothetical protein